MAEPKCLVGYDEVLCNECIKAIRGKGCHRLIKDPDAYSETTPGTAHDGERYAGRQRLGEKGMWALYLDVDIRHRLREDVHALIPISADEKALQRLDVLRSVCVSHDIRKES